MTDEVTSGENPRRRLVVATTPRCHTRHREDSYEDEHTDTAHVNLLDQIDGKNG